MLDKIRKTAKKYRIGEAIAFIGAVAIFIQTPTVIAGVAVVATFFQLIEY